MLIKSLLAKLVSYVIEFIEKFTYYPFLKKSLIKYSLQAESIIDVGANKGQSLKFFRSLFPTAKIYCFEPNLDLFDYLQKLENELTEIHNLAIGDFNCEKIFYKSILTENSTFILPKDSSKRFKLLQIVLLSSKKEIYSEVKVNMVTLDFFLQNNKICNIDILKIDVEGFEFEVLIGAQSAIAAGKINSILLEIHETDLRNNNFENINNFLVKYGYEEKFSIKHTIGNFSDKFYLLNR